MRAKNIEIDNDLLAVYGKYRGRGLRYIDTFHELVKNGTMHHSPQIIGHIKSLIEEGKLAKAKGRSRYFYGIPLTREDGTKFLIVNQGVEPEELDVITK